MNTDTGQSQGVDSPYDDMTDRKPTNIAKDQFDPISESASSK